MKNNIIRFISRLLSIVLATTLIITDSLINVHADDNISDPVIMVSLGDSYSSGEGIEPFYGQTKSLAEKVKDADWIAHRSKKSWSSQLKVSGVNGTMGDYKYKRGQGTNCEWYFAAAAGAETKHINSAIQRKPFNKGRKSYLRGDYYLPEQLTIFNDIQYGTVDYVTLTIGGNDVDFAEIIGKAALESSWITRYPLKKKLNSVWKNIYKTENDINQVYADIIEKAGPQAEIIVAGYPPLLSPVYTSKESKVLSNKEAELINSKVTDFNNILKRAVNSFRTNGNENIHFVDVESEFTGHEAYSSDPWINPIIIPSQEQDLKPDAKSAYSIHPNERGAKEGYAKCVNAKIEEIENSKKKGTLSGKICKATDRVSPVPDATISIYKGDSLYTTASADDSGNYVLTLPEGDYRIKISAPGYIDFTSYETVIENQNTSMETFLLVAGSESETGIATGTIKDALTGRGVEGVSLSIRKGWNNKEHGDVVSTAVTDSNGNYSVTLPLGNYTMLAEKSGYISETVNIIVQSGTTGSQNGSITPTISGDNFRIVLTWGANPRDLDSHVVGTLSQGNFHVYYGSKSAYDGDVEVCNLDFDYTQGYGQETITLNTSTSNYPFYYYIYRFAGSGTITTSEAQIKVYKGENLVRTFNVPTDQGSEDYWNVFAIVNGQLVVKNTITSNPDVSYASTSNYSRKSKMSLLSLDDEILKTEPKKEKTVDREETNKEETKKEKTIDKEKTADKETPVEESTVPETEMKK